MSDGTEPAARSMTDGCGCSNDMCCGGRGPTNAMNRRQFMKSTAVAGGIGLLASGAVPSKEDSEAAWQQWNDTLMDRGSRRWYSGTELEHIEMPMGGIGAGQIYLGGRGSIGPWQIVNNFNSMGYVPGGFFGVWTKKNQKVVARVLEEAYTANSLPLVDSVEFAGEYPFAWIRYHDDALPIEVSLESYCPLIPLNTKDSALPAVVFRFTLRNTGSEPVDAAVMASMPNLVGWNGYTEVDGPRHVGYIGNTNRPVTHARDAVLRLGTSPGRMASFTEPRSLVTNAGDIADAMQLCDNLTVSMFGSVAEGQTIAPDVYWLGDVRDGDIKDGLAWLLNAVEDGASLVVGAGENSLLSILAKPDTQLGTESTDVWRDALPVSWRSLERVNGSVRVSQDSPFFHEHRLKESGATLHWRGKRFRPTRRAEVLVKAADDTPLVVAAPYGNGRIAVCLASFDDPAMSKAAIGALVAHLSATEYTPQEGWPEDAPFYGSMVLAAVDQGDRASMSPQWDDTRALWDDFAADGCFNEAGETLPSAPGRTWNGALSVPVSLEPGAEQQVTFVLTWHFPNRMRDFRYGLGPQRPQFDYRLGNQYNHWFSDAVDAFQYVSENFDRLDRGTREFHDVFYDSTLPYWLLDAVSANLSIVRSPIIMWLEDGTVAGFEGTDACCPMNCTHVYNYAMSMAFIFPELERIVREVDLLRQMNPDEHFIPHRTLLPLELPRLGNTIAGPLHHALDGELGTILKTYREWRFCGDDDWLRTLWDNLKLVMRHVLDDHDAAGDGVLRGEQPNTYDIHTYGSNTFVGSLYLAALRATEEMARHFDDDDFAQECRARFESGSAGYDATCWTGTFYRHVYDSPEATPAMYEEENSWGPGCHVDQVFGQWWAHIVGLGYVLPREHVKQALAAIHKHNWRRDFHDHEHNQRVFAEGDEKGLLCCTWPDGGRPENPVKYCDEVWTGLEYHVAASLMREGLVHEGMQIARGARDRYTGAQRNPWSELECGGHYARAMAAHDLLLAAGQVHVDLVSRTLSFAPSLNGDDFKSFFSTGSCWGSISQQRNPKGQANMVEVTYGTLELKRLQIDSGDLKKPSVRIEAPSAPGVRARTMDAGRCMLVFDRPVALNPGERLAVWLS